MCETDKDSHLVSKAELQKIYDERTEKAIRYCGADGVLMEEETSEFYRLRAHRIRCKSWFCPVCKHRNLRMLRAKIMSMLDGSGAVFLTLTTRDVSQDQIESIKKLQHDWDLLLKRMRRKFGKFKYFKIVEFHKNGQPHLHVLLDKYIPQQWLSRTWANIHDAYIVDVRYRDAGRCMSYATKYLQKELSDNANYHALFAFAHMRRFAFSRDAVCDNYSVTLFPVSTRQDYYRIIKKLLACQERWEKNPDFFHVDFCDDAECCEFVAWHWTESDLGPITENVCETEQLYLPF